MKNYSDQEVIQFINKAPQPIQELIGNINTALEIATIGKNKKLHIDQIGKLAELNRNMLLGLIGPEDFLKELIAIGISDADAKQIMTEINQKIFVPLREQMMKGAVNAQKPVKPTEPVKPIPTSNESSFINPTPANPQLPRPITVSDIGEHRKQYASTPKYFHLENKIVPPPANQSGLASALKQVLQKNQTPIPQKQLADEKLLKDHEEPHIDIGISNSPRLNSGEAGKTQTVSSGVIPPGVRFSPRSAEVVTPIAPKIESPIPPAPPKPIVPPTPLVTPPIEQATTKQYSTDPYREPIDEK